MKFNDKNLAWEEVDDENAIKKVHQALREKRWKNIHLKDKTFDSDENDNNISTPPNNVISDSNYNPTLCANGTRLLQHSSSCDKEHRRTVRLPKIDQESLLKYTTNISSTEISSKPENMMSGIHRHNGIELDLNASKIKLNHSQACTHSIQRKALTALPKLDEKHLLKCAKHTMKRELINTVGGIDFDLNGRKRKLNHSQNSAHFINTIDAVDIGISSQLGTVTSDINFASSESKKLMPVEQYASSDAGNLKETKIVVDAERIEFPTLQLHDRKLSMTSAEINEQHLLNAATEARMEKKRRVESNISDLSGSSNEKLDFSSSNQKKYHDLTYNNIPAISADQITGVMSCQPNDVVSAEKCVSVFKGNLDVGLLRYHRNNEQKCEVNMSNLKNEDSDFFLRLFEENKHLFRQQEIDKKIIKKINISADRHVSIDLNPIGNKGADLNQSGLIGDLGMKVEDSSIPMPLQPDVILSDEKSCSTFEKYEASSLQGYAPLLNNRAKEYATSTVDTKSFHFPT